MLRLDPIARDIYAVQGRLDKTNDPQDQGCSVIYQ